MQRVWLRGQLTQGMWSTSRRALSTTLGSHVRASLTSSIRLQSTAPFRIARDHAPPLARRSALPAACALGRVLAMASQTQCAPESTGGAANATSEEGRLERVVVERKFEAGRTKSRVARGLVCIVAFACFGCSGVMLLAGKLFDGLVWIVFGCFGMGYTFRISACVPEKQNWEEAQKQLTELRARS